VLSALRSAWPDAHLAWVVNKGLRGLLDGHEHLDEVIPFDRGAVGFSPRGLATFASFARSLRERKFDLAIDLQGLLRSGLMTAATGASYRVGLAEAREGAGRFYSHRIATNPDTTHAVDKMMHLVASFGIEATPSFLPAISQQDHAWAVRSLLACAGPRLVVNVGARWLTKRWPPTRFAEVARRAVAELGASLIAVGAREDRALVEELKSVLGEIPILDLSGRTTLPQLAAVMSASDCVLSNDTGPLHLAAATGVRVVGVYTCTSPAKTGPYGIDAVSVASKVWCAGSCVKTCSRMECMGELTADRVYSAVRRQLDEAMPRRVAAS
jgi:ADP-heptose:LPS heptosyltransferase